MRQHQADLNFVRESEGLLVFTRDFHPRPTTQRTIKNTDSRFFQKFVLRRFRIAQDFGKMRPTTRIGIGKANPSAVAVADFFHRALLFGEFAHQNGSVVSPEAEAVT